MVNQKLCVVLEVEKNGRQYSVTIPAGSPFADCYDVLLDMISNVKDMEKNNLANQSMKQSAEDDIKAPETPVA